MRTFKVDEDAWEEFLVRCRKERTSASAALRAFVGDGSVVRGRGRAAKVVTEPVAAAPAPKVPPVVLPDVPGRVYRGPISKAQQAGKRK